MIEFEELKVGSEFYVVERRSNAFNRNKLTKIIDGQEWFTYDKPLVHYTVQKAQVIGKLEKHLQGEGFDEYDIEDELAVEYLGSGYITTVTESSEWFSNKVTEWSDVVFRTDEEARAFVESQNSSIDNGTYEGQGRRDNMSSPGDKDYDS